MKKLLYIFIAFGLILQACNNDDFENKFDKSPDQRIKERIQKYSEILTSPEYGWKTLYYPSEDSYGGFQFQINFDDLGVASVIGDITGEIDTSLYKIKAEQDILLSFVTYSQFHKLSDPIEGNPGDGIGGDFEFFFKEITAEKIVLKGKIGGSTMVLYPAEESTENGIKNMNIFSKLLKNVPNAPFFREIDVTEGFGSNISFAYSDNREVTITFKTGDGEVKNERRKIYFTPSGFSFSEPVEVEGKAIEKFNLNIDSELFEIVDSEIKGSVKYSNAPAFTIEGGVDAFLAHNFYGVVGYSDPLKESFNIIKNSISGFNAFQLYSQWGYFIGFNPTIDDAWAGFAGITYGKAGEDIIVNQWAYNVIGSWWKDIYNAPDDAGKVFTTILFEPNGMYVVPDGAGFILVSKAYPMYYFKVSPK